MGRTGLHIETCLAQGLNVLLTKQTGSSTQMGIVILCARYLPKHFETRELGSFQMSFQHHGSLS